MYFIHFSFEKQHLFVRIELIAESGRGGRFHGQGSVLCPSPWTEIRPLSVRDLSFASAQPSIQLHRHIGFHPNAVRQILFLQ